MKIPASAAIDAIPLLKDSQECQLFITPDGDYTPTRVLHGTRKATQHLQSMLVVRWMTSRATSEYGWCDRYVVP
jgi:hypothetical protein